MENLTFLLYSFCLSVSLTGAVMSANCLQKFKNIEEINFLEKSRLLGAPKAFLNGSKNKN